MRNPTSRAGDCKGDTSESPSRRRSLPVHAEARRVCPLPGITCICSCRAIAVLATLRIPARTWRELVSPGGSTRDRARAPAGPHTSGELMFDHVKFGVSDYAASKAFFLKALEPLGISVVSEGPPTYGVEDRK